MSVLRKVDQQVLKLVDYLIQEHKEKQTRPDLVKDSGFGVRFYPNNRNIITHMRGSEVKGGKEKSAPRLLIMNIAEEFNIDYNFFFDDSIKVEDAFLGEKKKPKSFSVGFDKTMSKENETLRKEQENLHQTIQKLHEELAACHKSIIEAKNGETDALRQLLAVKSNN